MQKTIIPIICAVLALLLVACHKDYSYEGGLSASINAIGSLKDSSGNCQGILVNGVYQFGIALTAANNIVVTCTITQPGNYSIGTDTVNGYWFSDTGSTTKTGLQTITIKSHGTPTANMATSFTVRFRGTACNFTIPASTAMYSFNAPTGSCPTIAVNGTYTIATLLNNSDTVTVPITVTNPGPYNIQTTTVNGISFAAKGVFANTGNYNVAMVGSGAPTAVGSFNVPLTVAGVNCGFTISVKNKAIDTTLTWSFTAEGVNYTGYIDSVSRASAITGFINAGYPNDRIYAISTYGTAAGQPTASLLGLSFGRVNHDITLGSYFPSKGVQDFTGSLFLDILTISSGYLYQTDFSLPKFAIQLTAYDTTTGLVQGTFSGPVFNSKQQSVQITNGQFKTYLGH